jgi:predicted phosphoribosyltransferase
VLAVPVGASATVARLDDIADEVVCLLAPPDFHAVGAWYRDFTQVSDDEVLRLLER